MPYESEFSIDFGSPNNGLAPPTFCFEISHGSIR